MAKLLVRPRSEWSDRFRRPCSAVPLSVHPSRGGRPWIKLSENDKSVPLGPVFQLNMQNKMQISSYLRLSSRSARLGFTGAIEKAETQCQ